MFDQLETGNTLGSEEFEKVELSLRWALLEAQLDLAKLDYPLLILIGGLEGSGKGSMVQRLNEWMDPRGIETVAFLQRSDEEESRPYFWRFWRKLPPRGKTAMFIDSWYNKPGYGLIEGWLAQEQFETACEEINGFERMLRADGALVIKIWLHVSEDFQHLQLAEEAPRKEQNPRVPLRIDHDKVSYKKQVKTARRVLESTNTEDGPWYVIDAEDRLYRDVTVGQLILRELRIGNARAITGDSPADIRYDSDLNPSPVTSQGALAALDMSQALAKPSYKKKLAKAQSRLQDLAWLAHEQRRPVVAVFEGWDAAGKGSAIRRVTAAMDPRLYNIVQFAAPTDEERAQHYLWRFWRRLERDGRATLYDRSWYGRVLVERVEEFARPHEWQRAYGEIKAFENQLTEHGCILLKFWLHITEDVQLQRFHEREKEPHKQHKITGEDWRNREKWAAYEEAVEEMIARTSTDNAPWTLIEGNNKRHARVRILKTFCDAIENALE